MGDVLFRLNLVTHEGTVRILLSKNHRKSSYFLEPLNHWSGISSGTRVKSCSQL